LQKYLWRPIQQKQVKHSELFQDKPTTWY
jgi:hypothetical protein